MKRMGHGGRWKRADRVAVLALLALAACKQQDPEVVASNCDQEGSCVPEEQALERIEEVDILLVIDSSGSIEGESEALKAQLPRMLNAIVTGSDQDTSFPPASSVHVAVATSDMGLVGIQGIEKCEGAGDDGIFLQPGVAGVTCDVDYPGFLAYDGAAAAIATVDTVSCVPLTGTDGCGFEQPLEAGLKALWPASNDAITFHGGPGHGEGANAGFLRPNSLLVVVVVTDEDDCSAADLSLFVPNPLPDDPIAMQALNLRCFHNPERLYAPERYIENFKALRPHNDNVIFATISGIPADLLSEEARAGVDFAVPAQVDAFYDAVLADPRMQEAPLDEAAAHGGSLTPSCDRTRVIVDPEVPDVAAPPPTIGRAYPPRRLIEVARGFGTNSVLGSICADDFGDTTGAIIRAIGERLVDAAAGPPDAG
jgi:hypothetical protein